MLWQRGSRITFGGRLWCVCQRMFDLNRLGSGKWLVLVLPRSRSAEAPPSDPYLRNRATERERAFIERFGSNYRAVIPAIKQVATALSSAGWNILLITGETPEEQFLDADARSLQCENEARVLSDENGVLADQLGIERIRLGNRVLHPSLALAVSDGCVVWICLENVPEPDQLIQRAAIELAEL